MQVSGGNFVLNRVYPVLQIQSPFCVGTETPSTSTCTCTANQYCEQLWEFQSPPSPNVTDFASTFQFNWRVYENYNFLGTTITSYFNLQVVLSELISQAISVPITLDLYNGAAAAASHASTQTTFSSGDSVYASPQLQGAEKAIFSVNVDTFAVCYLPNGETVSINTSLPFNQTGCFASGISDAFRATLVSSGVILTNYALANEFNTTLYSGGALQFSAVPLSIQPNQTYYIHAIYDLTFANGTAKRAEFFGRASTNAQSGIGYSTTDFVIRQGAPNTQQTLSGGAIAGIVVAGAFVVIFIVFAVVFSLRQKNLYKKLTAGI